MTSRRLTEAEGAPPPGCAPRCPACPHRALSRDESESRKLDWLRRALAPWAESLDARIRSVDERWAYRRRATLHARWRDGGWRFGVLLPRPRGDFRSEPEFLAIPGCPVHHPDVNRAAAFFARLPADWPVAFLVVSGALATVVLKEKPRERSFDFSGCGLRGVWLNFHPAAGDRVLSSSGWRLAWGEGRVREEGWVHGPDSFGQQLPSLHRESLREAGEFLVRGGERVVDLCSGSGRSLAEWRERGASAWVGVELGGESVECAGEMGFALLRGKASERLPQLRAWVAAGDGAPAGPLVAYANPPRLGLEPEVVRWLRDEARPERLAYLSCSAGTLARDLAAFCGAGGYRVERLVAYDFFPQTAHVETLALLRRE